MWNIWCVSCYVFSSFSSIRLSLVSYPSFFELGMNCIWLPSWRWWPQLLGTPNIHYERQQLKKLIFDTVLEGEKIQDFFSFCLCLTFSPLLFSGTFFFELAEEIKISRGGVRVAGGRQGVFCYLSPKNTSGFCLQNNRHVFFSGDENLGPKTTKIDGEKMLLHRTSISPHPLDFMLEKLFDL